jgi:hypothetical protein
MKKLITICLLMATIFSVKAQDMNFEETVKYINDKIECCKATGWNYQSFEANKTGRIKFGRGVNQKEYYIFDLITEKNTTSETIGGTTYYKYYGIQYGDDKTSLWYDKNLLLAFSTSLDCERVYNAIKHLYTLCTKEKDPFDK